MKHRETVLVKDGDRNPRGNQFVEHAVNAAEVDGPDNPLAFTTRKGPVGRMILDWRAFLF